MAKHVFFVLHCQGGIWKLPTIFQIQPFFKINWDGNKYFLNVNLNIYRNTIVLTKYRDEIYQCMTSTQELVGIHNYAAHKSWSKYTYDNKVGKVN